MMALIVPTTLDRLPIYKAFLEAWKPLIEKHNLLLITIHDGDNQYVEVEDKFFTTEVLMGENKDLIYQKDTACKNLGLYYCAQNKDISHVFIFDDDTRPIGDPIADHLSIMGNKVPFSWLSTASHYMRGFPYGIRNEAEIVVSHGVWEGVPDLDAPTQLTHGIVPNITYPKQIIPKGTLFPFCGMNVCIARKALPYLYFAPPYQGMSRCDDIFGGIVMKKELDRLNLACVTGFSRVLHERASNVYKNLQKEALFIELNESFWKGDTSHPYFNEYLPKKDRFKELMLQTI